MAKKRPAAKASTAKKTTNAKTTKKRDLVLEFDIKAKVHVVDMGDSYSVSMVTVDLADISEHTFSVAWDKKDGLLDDASSELNTLLFGEGTTPPICWEGFPSSPEFSRS